MTKRTSRSPALSTAGLDVDAIHRKSGRGAHKPEAPAGIPTVPPDDYFPRAGSLPALVCNYLGTRGDIANLDAEEIADRFGVPQAGIHTQLRGCVDAGLLKRADSATHGIVYVATAKLRKAVVDVAKAAEAAASISAPSAPSTASATGTGKKSHKARQVVDLTALPIDTSVPPPVGRTHPRYDYDAALDRLSPPAGKRVHSFLLPGDALGLHQLKKHITRRNKAGTHRYIVRTEPGGAVRVWRTA